MRKILSWLPFLILLGFIWFYRAPLTNIGLTAFGQMFPCRQPITYRLGEFDPRFNISKEDLLISLTDAERIWEIPSGKDLFKYDEKGSLVVNLVYDARQEATDRLKDLGIAIADDKKTYDALKIKYASLISEYNIKKAGFETALANYTARKSTYDKSVTYWNSRGGAPATEYSRLQKEKAALEAQFSSLNAAKMEINKLAETINALVDVLNRLATELNVTAKTYNRIGDSRGEEFEEGIYERSPRGQSITIYQFENETKLVRVLAHEMGHALGLPHLEDPQAIMYRLNQGASGKATAADLEALNARCTSHNLPFVTGIQSTILNFNN